MLGCGPGDTGAIPVGDPSNQTLIKNPCFFDLACYYKPMYREPSLAELHKIRQKLESGWDADTSYCSRSPQKGTPDGQCFSSSLAASVLLKEYSPRIVRGVINGCAGSHYWIEINGKIVDFTADQFDEVDLPPVVHSTYGDMPHYRKTSYRASAETMPETDAYKRFRLLLDRISAPS